MVESAEVHYARRRDEARIAVEALSGRATALSLSRVLAFLVAVAIPIAGYLKRWGTPGYGAAGAVFVVFVVLVVVHDRVLREKGRAERALAWADEGLARIHGKWSRALRAEDPTSNDAHPYSGDLDVFGQGSLMQSLDTTRTREGRAELAAWLSAGADRDEVVLRQSCARELSTEHDFREALAVEGALLSKDPPQIEPLLKWAETQPSWSPGPILRIIAVGLPLLTLSLLIFGGSLPIPRASWVLPLVVQFILGFRFRPPVVASIDAASTHQEALARYDLMFAIVEAKTFQTPALEALRRAIAGNGSSPGASAQSRALARIVGWVDARKNEVFRLIIGPLLSWDLNCAISLERWRARTHGNLRAHLATLARFEALCALATRAYERPDDAWPEILAGDSDQAIRFDATGLGHPLLSATSMVRNDVHLDERGATLLVTGSNMSGKSTLLRAMGSNVVLALAGAPVRATKLTLAPFDVHTSMRVRDSLSEGVSHFLAELRRLKQVIDSADAATKRGDSAATTRGTRAARPVLFLLDEILHGTNSRERHLGARAIVRHLVDCRACGAVSTHDLALGALSQECPGKVHNVHFREQVEAGPDGKETMTFDYHLRPGVVTSSNALRLMKIVGIDVAIPEDAPS